MRADVPRQTGYLDYYWDEYRGRRKIGSDHAPMRWRWFHRYEFEHLLARTGLRVCGSKATMTEESSERTRRT